ncbi:MAG TPA: DNA-protecting protein DprA [Frankiaceae bacterium]|nr:DNA-protecting protein DprA [Frankiaceae bacterium]
MNADDGRATDADRLARAGLSRQVEPGELLVAREVAARGAEAAWERVRRQAAACGVALEVEPEQDLANAERLGVRFVVPGDGEWPAALDDLTRTAGSGEAAAPWGLWVRGRLLLADLTGRAVAVVGSRAATSYGLHVAGELGLDLAAAGWHVVSGGAFGIDGAAHRGALVGCGTRDGAQGTTVVVLAGGVDVLYPRSHTALLTRVVDEGGLLASEAPPGSSPLRRRFLSRNRIIAALTAGTVVVEAGVRSGALNTARHARRLGRPVLGVPGPVTSGLSVGPHLLVRQWPEAQLVTNAAEVIEAVGRIGELAPLPMGPPGPRDGLEPLMHQVLDAVPSRRPRPVEDIARRCGSTADVVALVLQPLLTAGLVERSPDGWHLSDLGRTPSGAARTLGAGGRQ